MSAPLIVITGTSASGKTTILRELLDRHLVDAIRFVTTTTRPMRPDETHAKSYHFISKEEFERELAAGTFFEHATVYGQYYGSSKIELERMLAQDKPVLVILDVQGAETVRHLYPQTKVIFIDAPDHMLEHRLKGRATDPKDLAERLKSVAIERRSKEHADAVIESRDGELESSIEQTAAAVRRLSAQPGQTLGAVA